MHENSKENPKRTTISINYIHIRVPRAAYQNQLFVQEKQGKLRKLNTHDKSVIKMKSQQQK